MDYIKSITLFLVFIAFLENVLVLGNMKKYIRLFCGIILIFIILQPIGYIFGEEFDVSEIMELDDIESQMSELNESINQNDTILGVIENNVAELVELEGYELTYILVNLKEENVSVIEGISASVKLKSNDISIDKISIGREEDDTKEADAANALAKKIAGAYDIDESQVVINIE